MLTEKNLIFFKNHKFQKKVILNFISYLEDLRNSSEIIYCKQINKDSNYYYDFQSSFYQLTLLHEKFIEEAHTLVKSYEEFFEDFSYDINYKDKITLYENLTEAKIEIDEIFSDIEYLKSKPAMVNLYCLNDIKYSLLSYINLTKKGFNLLKEICNLSERKSLYEPSLNFYENEFLNSSEEILEKINKFNEELVD